MSGRGRTKMLGGSGPLFVVALLLASSGLLRFGDGPARAIALEIGEVRAHASAPEARADDEAITEMLAVIRQRETRLDERESALEDRLQALAIAEEVARRNLDELAAAEDRLRSLIAFAEEAAEGDLVQLTAVYENMKPKEAALLFEKMSPDFAAGFLGRMRPEAAAAILSGLKPDAAYSISVLLAGRNANAASN